MNKNLLIGGLVVVVLVAAGLTLWGRRVNAPVEEDLTAEEYVFATPAPAAVTFQPQTFTQIKGAHFVSSEPANNAVVTTALQTVKINFNFDLAAASAIAVTRNEVDVVQGPATIAADKLSMSVPVSASETGDYLVNYKGCWPDGSCHDGSFGFSVKLTP